MEIIILIFFIVFLWFFFGYLFNLGLHKKNFKIFKMIRKSSNWDLQDTIDYLKNNTIIKEFRENSLYSDNLDNNTYSFDINSNVLLYNTKDDIDWRVKALSIYIYCVIYLKQKKLKRVIEVSEDVWFNKKLMENFNRKKQQVINVYIEIIEKNLKRWNYKMYENLILKS